MNLQFDANQNSQLEAIRAVVGCSRVNRLSVIANEGYESFARQLQARMSETDVKFTLEMVQNEGDKV